jgi:NADH-quinone oxidoreductase subunit J
LLGLTLVVMLVAVDGSTGVRAANAALGDAADNTRRLGEALFTDMVYAVELTAILLTVAVVGAVALARRLKGPLQPIPVEAVAAVPADEGAPDLPASQDPSPEGRSPDDTASGDPA